MLMPTYLLAGEFSDFEDIIREVPGDIIHFSKGEAIIPLGAVRPYCYYVVEGLAVFSIVHESGRNKNCTFRGKGTIFPLYYSYDSTIMEQYLDVRAFTDVTLIRLTRTQIYSLMTKHAHFAIAMCDCYCKYATILQYDLETQLFDSALVKTSNFLYLYLKYMHPSIPGVIELSQEEIGNTIGLSRSNTSRALNTLKSEKIIENYRGMIKVISMEGIIQHCSDISFYFADDNKGRRV